MNRDIQDIKSGRFALMTITAEISKLSSKSSFFLGNSIPVTSDIVQLTSIHTIFNLVLLKSCC